MTIATGTKLGSYEITGAIGAGGMGEVYRARDAKLGRDVALKVLPEAFARDAERMARFQHETQAICRTDASACLRSVQGQEYQSLGRWEELSWSVRGATSS
jgi:serine/threonine protein kinase